MIPPEAVMFVTAVESVTPFLSIIDTVPSVKEPRGNFSSNIVPWAKCVAVNETFQPAPEPLESVSVLAVTTAGFFIFLY